MQQALYNPIAIQTASRHAAPKASRPSLVCHFVRRWDLYGVLALMASSAAYALAALAHLA